MAARDCSACKSSLDEDGTAYCKECTEAGIPQRLFVGAVQTTLQHLAAQLRDQAIVGGTIVYTVTYVGMQETVTFSKKETAIGFMKTLVKGHRKEQAFLQQLQRESDKKCIFLDDDDDDDYDSSGNYICLDTTRVFDHVPKWNLDEGAFR